MGRNAPSRLAGADGWKMTEAAISTKKGVTGSGAGVVNRADAFRKSIPGRRCGAYRGSANRGTKGIASAVGRRYGGGGWLSRALGKKFYASEEKRNCSLDIRDPLPFAGWWKIQLFRVEDFPAASMFGWKSMRSAPAPRGIGLCGRSSPCAAQTLAENLSLPPGKNCHVKVTTWDLRSHNLRGLKTREVISPTAVATR